MRTFYLMGLKLEKIRQTFPREDNESDVNYELTRYQPIINQVPETVYKYIGCVVEADGHLNLVFVLEDGYYEAALKKASFEVQDETLAMIAKDVLTPGVWSSREQDD